MEAPRLGTLAATGVWTFGCRRRRHRRGIWWWRCRPSWLVIGRHVVVGHPNHVVELKSVERLT